MALLGSRAIVGVLWDPLRSTRRSIHGTHGGRTPVRSRPGAHTSRSHARGATGAGVSHELVVIGRTSHLANTNIIKDTIRLHIKLFYTMLLIISYQTL